jgi:hypothetical protein
MAIAVDLVFMALIAALEALVGRIKGVSVRYHSPGVSDSRPPAK